jgi:hypothetical protein
MLNAQTLKFQTFSLGGVERLSLPTTVRRSVRQKLLGLYRPHRPAAKLAWKLFPLFPGNPRIGKLYAVNQQLSARLEGYNWQRWLSEVENVLNKGPLLPVFYYPPQSERKKFSVLLIDYAGNAYAYAKQAWTGTLQQQHLQNERNAAERLSELKPKSYTYPLLIHSGCFEEKEYNLFQPLHEQCHALPNDWGRLHRDYWQEMKEATLQRVELRKISWWQQAAKMSGDWSALVHWLEEKDEVVECCAAHGDFAPWNLCVTEKRLTVFDWEYFEPCAPILLDPVYFVLSVSVHLLHHSNYADIFSTLCEGFFEESQQSSWSTNLVLAFIYLRLQIPHAALTGMLDKCAERFRATFVTA